MSIEKVKGWKVDIIYEGMPQAITTYVIDRAVADMIKEEEPAVRITISEIEVAQDEKGDIFLLTSLKTYFKDEEYLERYEKRRSIRAKLTEDEIKFLNFK